MSIDLVAEAPCQATDYPSEVTAYLRGNQHAGEQLARTTRDILRRRIRRTESPQKTDELAQDCMLQVFARLPEFDPEKGQYEAWVSGFALNAVRSERRREFRSRVIAVPVEEVGGLTYEMTQIDDRRGLLNSALSGLEQIDRELLRMRFGLGMSSDEIAESQGLNAPQVRKRISRSVERLRRHPAIQQLIR